MLFAPVTSKGITLMSSIGLGMLGLVLRETDPAEAAMALPPGGSPGSAMALRGLNSLGALIYLPYQFFKPELF